MLTLSYRTLVAFFAGVTLTIAATFTFQAWRADAAPGDTDTTFVPITPCRLADTRAEPDRVGTEGTFAANTTKTFPAHDTHGECTIPTEAVGLSLNVTAIGATQPTFLTIWPDGNRPNASSLNPSPDEPPVPNAVTTPLSAIGAFRVYNLQGTVNVILDVNGYYTKSTLHDIDTRLTALEANQPVTASGYAHLGGPALKLGPTVVEVVAATLAAPSDGKVTVIADAHIYNFGGDTEVSAQCSISTGLTVEDGHQMFRSMPPGGALSGVRVFDVTAGETTTYRLNCFGSQEDIPGVFARNAHLAAIFTPAA